MKNFRASFASARVLGFFLITFLCGCASEKKSHTSGQLQGFEFNEPQMGVPFKIILYAPEEQKARRAADAAFKRVAELNRIMSDYETDSELNQFARSASEGKEVPLSEDLWNILWKSQEISRRSHGAFDVTIGPCVTLWRKARREHQLPEPERVERARALVGYTNLVLRPRNHSARLLRPNMYLDLGGIAKGYAADEALKTLQSQGITSAFVAASGDIAIGAPPPGKPGWRIGIAGYDAPRGPRQMDVYLKNCGVSTSGDASQRLEINGIRYSHILNPFTCVGLTNHSLVTVIAPNATISDTLDTTLCIIEPKEGLALAKKYHARARIIRETPQGLDLVASPGFDRIIRSKAARAAKREAR